MTEGTLSLQRLASLNTVPTLINDPSMLIVDDDKMQCPNAQFMSINAAVLAASPGATIRVCPGVYRESVLVDKALTLQGQGSKVRQPSARRRSPMIRLRRRLSFTTTR
jgi:pectin methylesterase-like acyl-CoA thioesterase